VKKHTSRNTTDGDPDTGDIVCQPVDKATASKLDVDCKLDGFNITREVLKNIVTDKPTPITRPLTAETLAKKSGKK
jgi:hypothetical protein